MRAAGVSAAFPASFHPATVAWFRAAVGEPTRVQARGWAAVGRGDHTLIAAPTGAGKTLAAFLVAIDALVRAAAEGTLPDRTAVLYVSPLKALGNDVARNLDGPLAGIVARLGGRGAMPITTAVRTGDTTPAERARMVRRPPHLLVTTPEGLYALLTSVGGRAMLGGVRTVIVDEIHALAPDRRGAHLALSLERLDALVAAEGGETVQRIGLSATQSPIEVVADFLAGTDRTCTIVDEGHAQRRDLRLVLPPVPLGPVLTTAGWDAVIAQVAELVRAHRTTLVFVNSRRTSERVAHLLGARLGREAVAAHHGSLAPALRLDAEARLKAGRLRALVATASLELGLDIGDVDLVVQLGSVKRIATLLQRVGRANHRAGGVPTGRVIPLTQDDLVESVALLGAIEAGTLDRVTVPDAPLDVLAQQVVAACVTDAWPADALVALVRRAHPYRALDRADFDRVVATLTEGFATERGRRGQLLAHDPVSGTLTARRGARVTALSSGGTIPDSGDYTVRLEPDGVVVGAVAEDFAIHQLPGHVLQLGSSTWRVLRVAAGEVRVERAPDEAPYMPVWFGEQPARSDELSHAVGALRDTVGGATAPAAAAALLAGVPGVGDDAAEALVGFLAATREALGVLPSTSMLVLERFRDASGGSHVVVHAPVGVRVTRAWALVLRHVLMARTGVELQASATDDGLLLSMPGAVDLPVGELVSLARSDTVGALARRAVLEVPMFMVRWRWIASRALLVPRMRAGRRVPPHLQRSDADELLLAVLGDDPARAAVGRALRTEPRQGGATVVRAGVTGPSAAMLADAAASPQPLLRQAIHDCLHDACDLHGLAALLEGIEHGRVAVRVVETAAPSPAAYGFVTARPPAFLDGGALMDRRTRGVRAPAAPGARPAPLASLRHLQVESVTAVHPEAVARVRREVAPDFSALEDATAQLQLAGVVTDREIGRGDAPRGHLATLADAGRALRLVGEDGVVRWGALERASELAALYPGAGALASARGVVVVPCDPVEALARLLAGRLETSGPVTVGDVVRELALPAPVVQAALDRLVAAGAALAGHHDPERPDEPTWCDRRVLSRIERLTRNHLRAEVDAVPLDVYRRFLLLWQGVTPSARRRGREGVVATLETLDGLELPVAAWEASVLPARIGGYDLDLLDDVCLSGAFGWGRLSLPATTDGDGRRATFTRATPVALCQTDHMETWRAFAVHAAGEATGDPFVPSPHAAAVLAWLRRHGPTFLGQLERALVHEGAATGDAPLDAAHLELALLELVGGGALTADAFAAVRGLLARPARWGVPRLVRLAKANVGRWSLLPPWEAPADPVARDRAVERHARALLRRYGIVVRPVVQQESGPAASAVRWGELLRVLRRLEARGEVRGGYFVAGTGGEHFALPEAIPLLREVEARGPAGELVALAAADPLNLTGVLDDGPRVASRATGRVLLEDGTAIGALDGRRMVSLRAGAELTDAQRAVLRADVAPAALAAFT